MKKYPGADAFIDFLENILLKETVTSLDIFKAYFIAKDYFCKKENAYDYRIVPCLFFEPHMGDSDAYFNLFGSFKYKMQMSGFRDPLKRLASGFRREDVPPYGLNLPVPCSILENVDHIAIKFEDLKLHPEAVCKDLSKHLNIRYTDKMLDIDYSEKSSFGDKMVKGYDIQPVIRPVDDVLGIFDQMRLRYFFKESMDYFEYPTFFGCELSDIEVENLFMIPFNIYYNLDSELTKEQSVKIIKTIRKKLINNYIILADDKRVRKIDKEWMPCYIKNDGVDSYKGSVSFNNENYMYSEDTEDIFKILDGFLIYFAQNQDMSSFKDMSDIQIIEKNILKLVGLCFEQKQLFDGNGMPVQVLYDMTNMRITLDKIVKDNNFKISQGESVSEHG